jgi:hypothetical protein
MPRQIRKLRQIDRQSIDAGSPLSRRCSHARSSSGCPCPGPVGASSRVALAGPPRPSGTAERCVDPLVAAQSIGDELGPRCGPELGEDVSELGANGPSGDEESLGCLLARQGFGDWFHDGELGGGEARPASRGSRDHLGNWQRVGTERWSGMRSGLTYSGCLCGCSSPALVALDHGRRVAHRSLGARDDASVEQMVAVWVSKDPPANRRVASDRSAASGFPAPQASVTTTGRKPRSMP